MKIITFTSMVLVLTISSLHAADPAGDEQRTIKKLIAKNYGDSIDADGQKIIEYIKVHDFRGNANHCFAHFLYEKESHSPLEEALFTYASGLGAEKKEFSFGFAKLTAFSDDKPLNQVSQILVRIELTEDNINEFLELAQE